MKSLNKVPEEKIDVLFETNRNNLVALLKKADGLADEISKSQYFSALPDELRSKVQHTLRRCYESLFDIVLIAPFQVGKSTTIGAFSDGREISPRGLGGGGIKTSACIIKIQNIRDKAEEENAIIVWRTDENLLWRIDEILGPIVLDLYQEIRDIKEKLISEEDPKQREQYKKEYLSKIDFRHPASKSRLEKALKAEIDFYQKNHSIYPEEKLDLLRFAIIILAYHDHPLLQKLRNQTHFQIEEIQSYIKFPSDFNTKWRKCSASEFDIEEVMYAFIEEVTCKIHSESLERSGMVIVDAPGLFASFYDTKIAMGAMQNASAIWYLFDGNRQPSQEDVRALKEIKDAGHAHKTFFGVNYRRKPTIIKNKIEGAILSTLQDLGFEYPHQASLMYFNAFLALRGIQGSRIMDNTLDENTVQQIILDANEQEVETENVKEAWLETTVQTMLATQTTSWKKVSSLGLCHETVNIVINESGWHDVTNKIKKYVFENKARSILIDNGCDPVINILKNVEIKLQESEKHAQENEEDAKIKWDEARTKLDEFVKYSTKIINDYIDETWDLILSNNFWHQALIACTDDTGKFSADDIATEADLFGVLGNLVIDIPKNFLIDVINSASRAINNLFDKKINEIPKVRLLGERCQKIVHNQFEKQFNIRTLGWLNSLKSNNNREYEEKILKKITRVCELLRERWREFDLDQNSYLKHLDSQIPQFSGDLKRDIDKYYIANFKQDIMSVTQENAIKELASMIGAIVAGGVISSVLYLPLDIVFPGLGSFLAALVGVIVIVFSKVFTDKDEYRQELSRKISSKLREELNKKEDEIKSNIAERLAAIRGFYYISLETSLNNMKEKLDERIKLAKENFRVSQDKRIEIAQEASEIRAIKIEPLRKEMEQFQSAVTAIWSR